MLWNAIPVNLSSWKSIRLKSLNIPNSSSMNGEAKECGMPVIGVF